MVLLGRDEARLAETAALLGDAEHRVISLDLTRHDSIAHQIVKLRKDVGPLYGLCHAAGVVATRPLTGSTVEVVQAQLNVNLLAGLELARVICRRDVMTPEGGSLLFLSSVYGQVGMPGQIGYCATKGAVVAAARAMAIELARRKIRVNCISPGLVFTEMTKQALGVLSADHVEKLKSCASAGDRRTGGCGACRSISARAEQSLDHRRGPRRRRRIHCSVTPITTSTELIMNTQDAVSWIAEIFEEPPEGVSADTPREEIPGWDSLGVLTLMAGAG